MTALPLTQEIPFQLELRDTSVNFSFLKVCTSRKVFYLNLSEIYYLQSSSNYTYINWTGGKILSAKTLKFYADQLGDRFVRSHRSYLVNKSHIKAHIKKTFTLELTGEVQIPISRVNRKFILNL